MNYTGGCHCGNIKFEVEGELKEAMACNCSLCARKGSLLWFVPRDKVRISASAADIGTYTFNKHVIKHHFCKTCGIHPYAEGVDAKGQPVFVGSSPEGAAYRLASNVWKQCRGHWMRP